MVLAEALLRVPDAATADRLIEDKLAAGDWAQARSDIDRRSWFRPRPGRSASRRASSSRARRRRTSSRAWSSGSACRRCGLATRQAMRLLGSHFVLGQRHRGGAVARRLAPRVPLLVRHARRGRAHRGRRRALFRGLRATRSRRSASAPATPRCRRGPAFRSSSRRCIRATRRCRASACSPSWCRACWSSRARRKAPRSQLHRRCRGGGPARAVAGGDRARCSPIRRCAGWDGFGLAVQAYQKRAAAVIDWLRDVAAALDRRLMVRLVKGAYWDTEVKRAQERGLAGLSGVHPQGDDRSLLHGLRRASCWRRGRGSIRSSPPTTR